MFIGHFGIALGAKRAAPTVSLGILFAACQWADLLWPTLVLLGIEHVMVAPGNTTVTPLDFVSYPYSHSLDALVLWAIVAATLYWWIRRSPGSAALVIALVVLSHWVLDWITHRPDMPLTLSGPTRVGLELWSSVRGTVIAEGLIFVFGVVLYLPNNARARPNRFDRVLDALDSADCDLRCQPNRTAAAECDGSGVVS